MTNVAIPVGNMAPAVPAVIAAGATESAAVNCAGMVLAGIMVPAVFTGTALTFEVGPTSDGFAASGQAVFSGVGTNNDTITINSTVITFKSTGPTGNQVLIGGTAAETAANLYAFLIASADAGLSACSYVLASTVVMVFAKVAGTAANAFTFAKSSTAITLTPSGGTLTGGGFHDLYDASNSLVSMTVAAARTYAVDPKNFQGVQYLKLKSGSTEVGLRTVILSLRG